MPHTSFNSLGFMMIPSVFAIADCDNFSSQVKRSERVGTRSLLNFDWCTEIIGILRKHPSLAQILQQELIAVQCTYFEKSLERNWLVPTHQDLSIPVAKHVNNPNLHGWSEKEGQLFVQAPTDILAQMVSIRVHLDLCGHQDGALRVVPRSHCFGKLSREETISVRNQNSEIICTAEAGDVLVMRPLLLHASSKSSGNSLRRVLQFLFAPQDLPYNLNWSAPQK
jgi:ectoine hydroxylase-related dioxygenase (phytanoyl-CoA dioxygenase family)